MIKSLKLTNFLSFGPKSEAVELRSLNVLIGPNGSGKSNFLDALELLSLAPIAAPGGMVGFIREGAGVQEWLWKDHSPCIATLEAVIERHGFTNHLRQSLSFTEKGQRFEIVDERIEDEKPGEGYEQPYFYYRYQGGHPVLNRKDGQERRLQFEEIEPDSSILAQLRDPNFYPELAFLEKNLKKMRFHRDWMFGRKAPLRKPQRTDLPNDFLASDFSNLGMVLNRLCLVPGVKQKILKNLKSLYEGIDDFAVGIDSGSAQVVFHEGQKVVSASHLSDGTLRYLALSAIFCDPTPPPLICIEEPELGLHPDVLPDLARLLRDASERCQVIVTTHSDILVDALSDTPEDVIICEKGEYGTTMRRLDKEDLKPWLDEYRLGEMWISGEIGGKRW